MATHFQQSFKTLFFFLLYTVFLFACSNNNEADYFTDAQSDFLSADIDNETWDYLAEDATAGTSNEDDSDGREIEEADIVKIDGTDLYILNAYRGLTICDVSQPDDPAVTGRCPINGEPIEMYIRDLKAYVIVSVPRSVLYAEEGATEEVASDTYETLSRVAVVDVEDPSNPRIVETMDLDGNVTDSRIVGDILYVVSSETTYYYEGVLEADTSIVSDEESSTVTSDEAVSTDSLDANVYVAALDLSDPDNITIADRLDFGGSAEYIHVTETAIFIAADALVDTGDDMTITYVDISDPAGDIRERGTFGVEGAIRDEFKMDYADGYFRVCTYKWDSESQGLSRLYIFDVTDPDAAAQVGSLELGEGEQLFATRFDGDRAYMVTFEQVDPLWVIDLSDPANPEIKGELEVPGWSTYIQAMEGHLVTLGIDDTDDQWRVSISLFDVTDPAQPALTDRVSLGEENGWSWSSASSDVDALTILDEMDLILLPYSTVSYTDGSYLSENRLQLIDYTATDLTSRGWVTQEGSVLRGKSYADRLFSVSTEELQVIDASDRDNPAVSAEIPLAENIVGFIPLENGFGVKVAEKSDTYVLQTIDVDAPEEIVEQTSLGEMSYASHFVNGNLVYLVENEYGWETLYDGYDDVSGSYETTTRVTVFDFTTPTAPIQRGSIDIEGYYDSSIFLDESVMIYPYSYGQEIIQVQEDLLAFVAVSAYDDEENVVVVVDFSDPDNPVLAARHPVEEDNAAGFFVGSGMLCYSYAVEADDDAEGRSQLRYYLGRIDASDPAAPETLMGINIPGTCVGMDETGEYAYTIDNQWLAETGDNETESTFNAVRIEDDTAYLLGEIALPDSYSSAFIADGLAYLGGYSWWYYSDGTIIIDLDDPENLETNETDLPEYVSGVIGAEERTAFLTMWYGIGCYDVRDPDTPELTDFQYGYSYDGRVIFSGDKAFLPMGYYGLWVKEVSF